MNYDKKDIYRRQTMPGPAKTPEAKARQTAHLNKPKKNGANYVHGLCLTKDQKEKLDRIKKNDRLLKKAIATLPPEYRERVKTFGEFTRAWVDSLPDDEGS